MNRRSVHFLTLVLLAILALSWQAAGPARGADAVDDGRKALQGDTYYPWYDPDTDQIRRIDLPPSREAAPPPSTKRTSNSTTGGQPPSSTSSAPAPIPVSAAGSVLGAIMMTLAWLVIAALFIAIVVLLVWAFLKRDVDASAEVDSLQDASGKDVDRLDDLPFQVSRPQGNLLDEARRLYNEGNYREAVIYLFSYQLVQLDKYHFIRLVKGRTNRQYLRDVRPKPALFQLVETTMIAFEDVFFGDYELNRERFENCWQGLDEFHNLVQQGGVG